MRRLVPLTVLVVAAFVLIAARCGGNDGDDHDGVFLDTGIEGTVTIGPMCPVVQEGTPCPDEPYQAEIVVRDENGDEVARFETAEDGTFSINTLPGRYTIEPQSPNEGAPPQAPEQQVEVRAGEYAHVDIQYDSGIR